MKILVADPDSVSRHALWRSFAEAGDQVRGVETLADGRKHLADFLPDTVVAALDLPDGDGLAFLQGALVEEPRRAVYALIDGDRLEDGVRAMLGGAHDFLWRPVSPERVALLRSRVAARRERERWLEEMRLRLARAEISSALAGRSPRWMAALASIEREAALEAPVLVTGEAGTEKEAAARALHGLSRRGSEPFVRAAPGEDFVTLREGRGTLFLSGLERIPTSVQRDLLTHLESPRGRRIVAATDEDPSEAIAAGQLLPDLFDALKDHIIHLPPLRERGEDTGHLARRLLSDIDSSFSFENEAIEALNAHDWPGNVRELRAAVRRAIALADSPSIGPTLVLSVLGRPLATRRARRQKPPVVRIAVGASLADVERRLIQKTLEFAKGNKPRAAELLKLSLKTIYNKIKEYKLDRA